MQTVDSQILRHRDAEIHISPVAEGKWTVTVESLKPGLFIHQRSCETSYSTDLIQMILNNGGPGYLCDEIMRDESPYYVQNFLHYDLLAYCDESQFKNKAMLDFGCGAGASTMILKRMFPDTRIIGVELEERLLKVARARADFYGYTNLELLKSPGPNALPPEVHDVDFVVLSGVYEHLLPEERQRLLPQIWKVIKPGGILFLNQTPHRGFPIELHTTGGLPFVNYLPDAIAHRYTQVCSKRNWQNASWETMLRNGIRGGSVREIFRNMKTCSPQPVLLEPSRLNLKDRLDLWAIKYRNIGKPWMIQCFHWAAGILKKATGILLLPNLSLALKKPSAPEKVSKF